ncbi:hypothetical protein RF11_04114 [Thelohanellus kitauei]|uniref:Uncharacterized protein n=1 Tax=Thelohanellus kitauei TaxID=669202 RepID=A0A0C2MFB6_THEKT|nr:hypothetical protein RF11_04114 [Thelohanellus kitauei]
MLSTSLVVSTNYINEKASHSELYPNQIYSFSCCQLKKKYRNRLYEILPKNGECLNSGNKVSMLMSSVVAVRLPPLRVTIKRRSFLRGYISGIYNQVLFCVTG